MAGGREFDRAKFKELVLYLSQASRERGDEGFGMVKLNKLLYRADSEAFRLLGVSITGEEYEKQDYGPVARDLPIVLDELGQAGYVIWQHVPSGPYERDIPDAAESPDMTQFSSEEKKIIDRTLDELADYGGKSVSEWSHREWAGWRVVGKGEEIPYELSIISSADPPADAIDRLRQRVLTGDWD